MKPQKHNTMKYTDITNKIEYRIHQAIKGRDVQDDYINVHCYALHSRNFNTYYQVGEKLAHELRDHSQLVFSAYGMKVWPFNSQDVEAIEIFEDILKYGAI